MKTIRKTLEEIQGILTGKAEYAEAAYEDACYTGESHSTEVWQNATGKAFRVAASEIQKCADALPRGEGKGSKGELLLAIASISMYVAAGSDPGDFCRAVLANDLVDAVTRADAENLEHLREIVLHVYNKVPSEAWGSKETVKAWIAGKHRV